MSRMVLGRILIAGVAASALGVSVACGTADQSGPTEKTIAASPELRALGASNLAVQGDSRHGVVTIYSKDGLLERVEFDQAEGGRSSMRVEGSGHRYELGMTQAGIELRVDGVDEARAVFDAATRSVVEDAASQALFASASDAIRVAAHAVDQVGGLAESSMLTARPREKAPEDARRPVSGNPDTVARSAGAAPNPNDVESGGTCYVNGQPGQIVDGTAMNSTYWTPWTKATGCYYATQNLNNDCTNQYCFGCNTITGCDCSCVLGDTLCSFCTAYGNACDCYVPSGGGGGGGGLGGCQNNYQYQLCNDECFPWACDTNTCDCAY